MISKKKRLITALILVVCLCVSLISIPEVRALITDSSLWNPGSITVTGMTVSEDMSSGADTNNVSWVQSAEKTINGIVWDPDSNTYSLMFTAEREGQFALTYSSTVKLDDGSVLPGNPSQIQVYLNGDPAQVVDAETVLGAQYKGLSATGGIMSEGDVFEVRLVGNGMDLVAINMTNVTFREPETYNITLNAPAVGGSYSYDSGEESGVIAPGDAPVTLSYSNISGLSLEANPAEGYKFSNWNNGNGDAYSGNASLFIQDEIAGNALTPVFMDENITVNFVVGSNPYDNWKDAFTAAAATEEKTVVALRYGGSCTLPADATPDGTYVVSDGDGIKYVIPEGFKLLVPYNAAEMGTFRALNGDEPDDTTTEGGTGQAEFNALTVPKGVKIEVAGALNVNAQQFKSQSHINGQVAGQYGHMVVNGTVDILEGGYFYCYGYATGSGTVIANSGAVVHEFLQVCDWPGGSNALGWFSNFVMPKQTAGEDGGSFAFNQYYAQNIECNYDIYAGAESYMDYTLYLTPSGGEFTVCAAPQFAGDDGLFQVTSGYIHRYYDAEADRMIYDLYGNIRTGNVAVSFSQYGAGLDLDSSTFILGITDNLTLNVYDGSYLTLNSSYQLLPEFTANVYQGGTMEIAEGTTLYIWDVNDWNAGTYAFGAESWDMVYSPTRGERTETNRPLEYSTSINLDGLLIMHNNVYTTDNGGTDIRKAITSINGTGEIQNTEGETVSNLRVIGRTDYYNFVDYAYNSAESEIYFPTIKTSVVVGHMYEQENLNDYAPILTGEYHYKKAAYSGGPEGWYNNYVTVIDLDTGAETEYPVGSDVFTLEMDETNRTIWADYEIISNAEFDEENSVVLSNHDGSEMYYANLSFKIGQSAKIGVRKETYEYIFGWYEETFAGTVRNVWYDVVREGIPSVSFASSAKPYTAEELYQMSQTYGKDILNIFNVCYGTESFENLVWGLSLMTGETVLDENDPVAMKKYNSIMMQMPIMGGNGLSVEKSAAGIMTATLNDVLAAENRYAFIPMLVSYNGAQVKWRVNYPDGKMVETTGETYTVADGEHFIVDGTPTVFGNSRASVSEKSTLKTVELTSSPYVLIGDITVDVNLKAYAYEVNYHVNNTSSTDSSVVTNPYTGKTWIWGGAYTRNDLAFATSYVGENGKNVLTDQPIELTYEELVGYNAEDESWRITATGYDDTPATLSGKFAFASASADGAVATLDNTVNGSVLKITNITADTTVNIDMYGYHFVVDKTVKEDGKVTSSADYVLYNTNLGAEYPKGTAVSDYSMAGLNGEVCYPELSPSAHNVTSADQTYKLTALVLCDCSFMVETKAFDHVVLYNYTTNTDESTAMSQSVKTVYYVKEGDSLDIPIPNDGFRYRFVDYFLFNAVATKSLKSENTEGSIVQVDLSDPDVLRISNVTQDIKLIGLEKAYSKKVLWQDNGGNVLQKDYIEEVTADATYAPEGKRVISSATVAITSGGTGTAVSLNNPVYPAKHLKLSTNGSDYDVVITLEFQDYDYEVVIDYATSAKTNEIRYISASDSITLGSTNGIYSDDGASRFVLTGIDGPESLNVTGPSDGNASINWGWPTAVVSGFTGDTTLTLNLQQFNNRVLWNIEAFKPTPDSSYSIQKYSYIMDGAKATLEVPAPYLVTAVTTGANPEYLSELGYNEECAWGTATGGDCAIRVTAQAVDHVITWMINGVEKKQYVFGHSTEKTITDRSFVTEASADNATDVSFESEIIRVLNIVGNPTITVTTTPYTHKLEVYFGDEWSLENTTYYMTEEEATYTLENRVVVNISSEDATVSANGNTFTVSGIASGVDPTIFVEVHDTVERLKLTNFNLESEGLTNSINITDSAYGEFSVTYNLACVVAMVNGDGYTLMEPKSGSGNTFTFKIDEKFDENVAIVVAVKGDIDGNGDVEAEDIVLAKQFVISGRKPDKKDPTPLQLLITDVYKGDGKIESEDIVALKQCILSPRRPDRKALTWYMEVYDEN